MHPCRSVRNNGCTDREIGCTDREIAFKLLGNKDLKDATEAKIVCKRARTAQQKQRNDVLIKALEALKTHNVGSDVKINWQERRIDVNNSPAFVQSRDSSSGSFLPPHQNLVL